MNAFWREVFTRSAPDEGPYTFFLIAVGHVWLGGAICEVSPLIAVVFLVGYLAFQVARDIREELPLWDSIIDTAFVGLGVAMCAQLSTGFWLTGTGSVAYLATWASEARK